MSVDSEEDWPVFWIGLLTGIVATLGTLAVCRAHQSQWHVRALRQIRALPEHHAAHRKERP